MADNKAPDTPEKIMEDLNKRISTDIDVSYLESGNMGLDLALTGGKGIPLGDWITFTAGPASGKTTILADALRRLLTTHKKAGIPFKAVFIDIENSKNLLASMGLRDFVKSQDLIHIPGQITFTQLDAIYRTILLGKSPMYKDVKLIVIDSLTGVISATNAEDSCEKAEFGNDAKALTKFLKKYVPLHEEKGITTFAVCQVRQNLNAGPSNRYVEQKKAALIDAAKHWSTVIVKLKKSTDSKNTELKKIKIKTIEGDTEEIQEKFIVELSSTGSDRKNRHGNIPDVSVLVRYGKGVINAYNLKRLLIGWGFVKRLESDKYEVSKDLPVEVKDTVYNTVDLNTLMVKEASTLYEFLLEKNMFTPFIKRMKEVPDGFEGG